jgi:hypothetical protein
MGPGVDCSCMETPVSRFGERESVMLSSVVWPQRVHRTAKVGQTSCHRQCHSNSGPGYRSGAETDAVTVAARLRRHAPRHELRRTVEQGISPRDFVVSIETWGA